MISGLARASRASDDSSLQDTADRALDSLFETSWRDGRLFATASKSPAIPAYLDDYAFLLDALIECLQNRWRAGDLRWSIELADALLQHFQDRDAGGFFFTADDHEKLIQRPKPWFDEAIPSGNGVAARALMRLGHLAGNPSYIDAAERTARRAAFPVMQQNPASCATLQRALREFLHPRTHVVIRVQPDDREKWRTAISRNAARARRMFTLFRTLPVCRRSWKHKNILQAASPTFAEAHIACRPPSILPTCSSRSVRAVLAEAARATGRALQEKRTRLRPQHRPWRSGSKISQNDRIKDERQQRKRPAENEQQ